MSSPDLKSIKRTSTSDGVNGRRRDREDRKRKKEEKEDVSRKKHKTRHVKGKDNHHHHHHKSSTKKKTKKRVSKRKQYTSSDSSSSCCSSSSSSSSSTISTRKSKYHYHKRHSSSRRRSAKRLNRDDEERRFKSDVKDHYEISKDDEDPKSPLEEPKLDKVISKICQEKSNGISKLDSHGKDNQKNDHEVLTYETVKEESLAEKKDLSLEVALRQKALANFKKHQDKTGDHNERRVSSSDYSCAICTNNMMDSIINTDVINKKERSYVDADCNHASLVSNKVFVKIDTKVGHKFPVAIPLRINNVVDPQLEEEEVIRGMAEIYTGNTYSTSASVEKDQVSNERFEELNHEGCREEQKLKLSSTLQEVLVPDFETQPVGSPSNSLIESVDLQHEQKDIAKCDELKGSQTAAHLHQDKTKGIISSQEVETALTATEENSKNSPIDGSQVEINKHQNDTGFQQKTMSVMKGGEVVQVSYKVYIPKRAAELARRRIQR